MRKIVFFLLSSLSVSFAQEVKLNAELGTIIGSKNTPFLQRANRFGTVPLEGNLGYGNLNAKISSDSAQKWSWGAGLETHINAGTNSHFLLPQAYVKGKFKAIELYIGRKKEIQGLVDTLGTMGSFIWSGNALPVPKIDIGIRQFTYLTPNGLLAVKGNFAHGWFGKGDSVQNVLLHQKSLYLRLGRPNWKIKMIGGMNHQAQWAGRPTNPFLDKTNGEYITNYGSSFKDFLNVLTGQSVGAQTGIDMDQSTGMPANEAGNRMGNHLGTVDLGFEFQLKNNTVLKIYRQSIYEDGSLFYLSNISDGLSGISIQNTKGFNLTLEYLNTTNQGGILGSHNTIPELRGQDNYFNNGTYKDSWTYKGQTLGSPLLNPYHENAGFYSVRKPGTNYIYNNRVEAFNIKAHYRISNLYFVSQILTSTNKGTYATPFKAKQTSALQSFSYLMKSYRLQGSLAFDSGKYYQNAFSSQISVRKTIY